MSKSSSRPIVIKIGGSTLGNHDSTLEDLVALQEKGVLSVVVHGGANRVTDWLSRLDIPTSFVRGMRVTDAQTLQVVVAVLGGLVNKELVSAINSLGGKAVGLSGIDGCLIEGRLKDPALGYVGQVMKVDPGHIALYEPSVRYDLARVRGVTNVLFSGEGLFLATLAGPGKIWLQSLPLSNLAGKLARYLPTRG